MSLKGRRLLILGGNSISSSIVEKAKEMGLYTYVLDWNKPEDSPAKLIADEYSMLSISDIKSVVQYIKKHHIDGVITGYTDSYLPYYAEICKQANLPCYAKAEHFALSLDKKLFKDTCARFKLHTIPEYAYTENAVTELADKLPLIFKPVDNSGSRGIIKCTKQEKIKESYKLAYAASHKGKVLIEKMLQCDDVSVAYTFRNGQAYLSIVCDRYFHQLENGGSVTTKLLYPSKYTDSFVKNVDTKLKLMFSELGYENGVLFLQMFVEQNTFYLYEMGYRLSGGQHYIFTKTENGVSALEMLINFAITGDMGTTIKNETPHFNHTCCMLSILCKKRTIQTIKGVEKIKKIPGVIQFRLMYNEGDTTGDEGTSAQITGKVHIVAPDMNGIQLIIKEVKENLVIKDTTGENMILAFSDESL